MHSMHDCEYECVCVCMLVQWSSYCRHKGRTHESLTGSPSVLLSFVEDSDKSLIASPPVCVCCVWEISAFCSLASITLILFAHNFCHAHTHTDRFFIIGSRSVILFRLINNFLQLMSGLETYLSLHAIHSPLQVQHSPCLSDTLPSLLFLPLHCYFSLFLPISLSLCCPTLSPSPELDLPFSLWLCALPVDPIL